MIELRWREVEAPNSRRDQVLTVAMGPWSFVLECRQWIESARMYSKWEPVPVEWQKPVGR